MSEETPPTSEPRRVRITVFKATTDWLRTQSLLELVIERLPAATAEIVADPLSHTWVDGVHLDALLTALEQLEGRARLLQMSRETAGGSFAGILVPLADLMLRLLGTRPSSIFRRFRTISKPLLTGVAFEYTETSSLSGTLRVIANDRPADAWFNTWLGSLPLVFEHLHLEGEVERFLILPGGRSADFALRWREVPTRR